VWPPQEQFNSSFGPTSQEVDAVKNFLSAQGLTALAVAENNMYVKVQGTVGAIQKAFHVQKQSTWLYLAQRPSGEGFSIRTGRNMVRIFFMILDWWKFSSLVQLAGVSILV
jgi:hypothetical protein